MICFVSLKFVEMTSRDTWGCRHGERADRQLPSHTTHSYSILETKYSNNSFFHHIFFERLCIVFHLFLNCSKLRWWHYTPLILLHLIIWALKLPSLQRTSSVHAPSSGNDGILPEFCFIFLTCHSFTVHIIKVQNKNTKVEVQKYVEKSIIYLF